MTGPQHHPKRPVDPTTRTGRILAAIPTEGTVNAMAIAAAVGHYPNLSRRLQRLVEEGRIIRVKRDGVNVYSRETSHIDTGCV